MIFTIFTIVTLADEQAGKTKIVIWAAGPAGTWMAESNMIPDFEAAYPQYYIEMTQYPWDNLHDKMIAGFMGGELPDIAMGADQWVAEFAALDGLEPLDDFKKANNFNDEDFVPRAWSHFITPDGKLHGAPMWYDIRVMFYRTDLFEKAGISHPPTNFDELVEDSMKLTNGIDQFGLAFLEGYVDFHFFSSILYLKGGNYYTTDLTKCALTEPAGIEAIKFYKSLYDKNIIPNDPAKQTDYLAGFLQGYYAMIWTGGYNLPKLLEHPEMEGKWATALIPEDKTKITYGHPNPWIIPAGAKNKDGAKAWLQFYMNVKPQIDIFKGFGYLPVLLAAYDEPAIKDDPKISIFIKSAENGTDSLHNVPNGDPISAVVYTMLTDLKSNKITPEDFAAAVCKQMNDLMSK
jgi:multiple sugar transport system substrate-binding protein